jgi:hypothetical protein
MIETGIWEQIVNRVVGDYDPAVKTQCEVAIRQLQNLEQQAMMALLRGENCITLWPREDD